MRLGWMLLVSACGRIHFSDNTALDATDGAQDLMVVDALDPILESCVMHLSVDELSWSGAGGEVTTRCGSITGTAVGGARVVDDLVRGRVAEFVGDPSCLRFPSSATLEPTSELTMSAWMMRTVDDLAPHGILAKRVAYQVASQYTLFTQYGPLVYVDINDETDRFSSNIAASVGAWTQVTAVYDGSRPASLRTRIYLDGQLDQIALDGESSIAAIGSPFAIGCIPDGAASQSFIGRLDDVIVWTRALDDVEVAAWYEQTR
ncbi:MAG: LamG domain-containing protein [Kofleriaceae bacterium]